MTMVKTNCAHCSEEFETQLKHYNSAVKWHGKQFCSKECRKASRRKETRQVKCNNCGKEKTLSLHVIEMSKTKRFYCNSSCAGLVNNKHRTHSEASKLKISEAINKWYQDRGRSPQKKNCLICGKEFRTNKKYVTCSRRCGQIYQHGSLPMTKEEVVSKLLELSQQSRTTPSSKLGSRLSGAAYRFFGGWNKAIEAVGLDPNFQCLQRKRITCVDGHVVDSLSERIIDEWLFENNLVHNTQEPYPEGKFTCDFYLTKQDVWLEYWGLLGMRSYEEGARYKRTLAQKYGMRLLEITPDDLYPVHRLDERLVVVECMSVSP